MALIELRDITKVYKLGDLDLPILKGITLSVEEGEFVALVGTSGSGKTTLMNLLGCLDQPTDGRYELDDVEVPKLSRVQLADIRGKQIGFVFQNFNLLPRTSALDNVLMPTAYSDDAETKAERTERARKLLEMVGLGDRMEHTANQMSGGERQRVAIARALINRPKLLLADEPTGNLDTNTEQEILALFQRLNREQGITLVVVTHDAEVSSCADRVIRMKDGVIAEDSGRSASNIAEQPGAPVRGNAPATRAGSPLPGLLPIGLFGAVLTAARTMRRNILRTALTMLGVIIGVASVVAVMEMSSGASRAIEQTVESMGVNTLTIRPGANDSSAGPRGGSATSLSPEDAEAIQRECPAVSAAAPLVITRVQCLYGNREWIPEYMMGTTPSFLVARNWNELSMGQSFADRDVRSASRVCILGRTVADELFDDEYPVGKEIRVSGVPLKIVGVLSIKGADILGTDQDDVVLVPWTTLKYRINGEDPAAAKPSVTTVSHRRLSLSAHRRGGVRNDDVQKILVQTHTADLVPEAKQQVLELLERRYRIEAGEDSFRVYDMTEVTNATDHIVGLLSMLGLVIAAVSLVVGGVGIMNIMLVSVTERTREIGLRMAVGASGPAILRQFLIEATVLCLLGGAIGIACGHGASMLAGLLIGWPTELSLLAPLVAVGVSVTVGIVFGYYPAWKASRLNPIDALRYE